MPVLLVFLGQIVAKIFTDKILGWLALKVIMVFLFTVIVPLILNNFLYDIIDIVMNFANDQSGGVSSLNGAMSFSGFSAWLIQIFRISEVLSVFVSALVLRLALSMIPFVRL